MIGSFSVVSVAGRSEARKADPSATNRTPQLAIPINSRSVRARVLRIWISAATSMAKRNASLLCPTWVASPLGRKCC